jgi:hypothetical protein
VIVATEGLRTIVVAAAALAAGFTWQSARTAVISTASPERLVSELRLAQFGALLLTLTAGAYIGIAAGHEARLGIGIDVALALGFFVVAAFTLLRDPRQALTALALAFAAHALVDVAHRPGLLPEDVAPHWYAIGCAIFDLYVGALCYYPLLRRS